MQNTIPVQGTAASTATMRAIRSDDNNSVPIVFHLYLIPSQFIHYTYIRRNDSQAKACSLLFIESLL